MLLTIKSLLLGIFFATSHGKRHVPACKQLKRQILTPMQLYSWANEHVTVIKVIFVNIAERSLKIKPRLQNAETVVGTRGHHRFVPLADNKL